MNIQSAGTLRKFGLFLAVIVCGLLAVGCVFGAWFFVSENFYTTPKDKKLAEFGRSRMWRDSVQIVERTVYPESDYYSDTPTDMLYAETVTNGYVVNFYAYALDWESNYLPLRAKHLDAFRSILESFEPVTAEE